MPPVQIGIVPRDLATSIAFYRDRLGLPYAGTLPVMEGRVLHLFTVPGGDLKLLELADPEDFQVVPHDGDYARLLNR